MTFFKRGSNIELQSFEEKNQILMRKIYCSRSLDSLRVKIAVCPGLKSVIARFQSFNK